MTENKEPTVRYLGDAPDDDLPDLSAPYWLERLPEAKIRRGRPKAEAPKISTTIRLSPEVIAHFKAGGPGWQSRIDAALRKLVGV